MAIRIPRLLSFQMTKSLLQSRSFCIKTKINLVGWLFPPGFLSMFLLYYPLSLSLSPAHTNAYFISLAHMLPCFPSNTITLTTSFGYPLPFICLPITLYSVKYHHSRNKPIKEPTLLSTLSTLNWPMRCHLYYMGCKDQQIQMI